jgi:hypothetical protein
MFLALPREGFGFWFKQGGWVGSRYDFYLSTLVIEQYTWCDALVGGLVIATGSTQNYPYGFADKVFSLWNESKALGDVQIPDVRGVSEVHDWADAQLSGIDAFLMASATTCKAKRTKVCQV